ncbi:MAG: hypothetical protein DA408_11650 [Bacteroidetes bacterium]|nr:MAG: hypothetical protein DA408_11650 [Bacteroidota bacterium]
MPHENQPVQGQIQSPEIALPKGGGASKGLGETFQPDVFSGTGSFRIPLPLTPGRGLEPDLELRYSSGSGNSLFGWDFSLNLPTISRRTDRGVPLYQEEDTFILLNSDHLVPELTQEDEEWRAIAYPKTLDGIAYQVKRYRPRTEGLYARIEHWTNTDDGTSHWQVRTAENVLHVYGRSPSARVFDPTQNYRIFQWNLEETVDAKGNRIQYEYKREDNDQVSANPGGRNGLHHANVHLQRIRYGNYNAENGTERWAFQVLFNYGEFDLDEPSTIDPDRPTNTWASRLDAYSTYRPGFEVRTHRRCESVLIFHHFPELGERPQLVRALELAYKKTEKMSQLRAARQIGFRKNREGLFEQKEMPLLEFNYQAFRPQAQAFRQLTLRGKRLVGYDDGGRYSPVDLYGEGIAGILYTDPDTSLYFSPLGGGTYDLPRSPATLPINSGLQNAVYALQDIDGDGNLELTLSANGINGYYALRPDQTWENFRSFPAFPLEYGSPLKESLDVDGNGIGDFMVDAGTAHRIYYSKGREGWSSPAMVSKEFDYPSPRAGSEEEVLVFADVFGDGGDHRVRISRGRVEVWPNLGHGKFGKPVLLGNAPTFEGPLNADQVFTADLDGNGFADIIYVHSQYLYLYFNQSGNAFSEPVPIRLPAPFDRISELNFADILGDGTTSLVISYQGPDLRHYYYPFSGGQKPHTLLEVDNNLGAVTRIAYKSSTEFYLADKKAGHPWVSKLPNPVQVIEKTETIDQLSGSKLVARYAYHHGHYDPWNRTFQGFGMVERWDTEAFAQYQTSDLSDTPFQTTEKALHALPVYTKTWYHTGVFRREGLYAKQFESEYFPGDPEALSLPDSGFEKPGDRDRSDSLPDAYRAMNGLVLREEIYSLDEQGEPARLYSVTENKAVIRTVQPQGSNKFGVYQALEQESIHYDYELDLQAGAAPDPRASHSLVLEFDAFGQALQTCDLAYPRRPANRPEAFPEQDQPLAICEWVSYFQETAEDEWYLWGIPLERRTFALSGLGSGDLRVGGSRYFSSEKLQEKAAAALANSQPFEAKLNASGAAARLIHWQRSFYWKKAADGSLIAAAFGEVDGLALEFKTETALHSQVGMHQLFGEKITLAAVDDLLGDPGKGAYLLRDGYWWNPRLRAHYFGAAGFYQLQQTLDPFDSRSTIGYDPYFLAIVQTTDALDNRYHAEIDYQVMQARRHTDLNGNTTEALFDPLGRVRLTSLYGLETDSDGTLVRRGDAPLVDDVHLTNKPTSLDLILAAPHDYLQGATTFFHYDPFAWQDRREPPYWMAVLRETHVSELETGTRSPCQITISYSDGFGRTLQEKLKVEPGLAWVITEGSITQQQTTDRWLTSGRTVYDNKGNPIKEYEPYYSSEATWQTEETVGQFGVSPVIHYDPLGRAIRKDLPKGFFEKIEFSAWEVRSFDANDTLADSLYHQFYRGSLSDAEKSNPLLNNLPATLSGDETDSLNKALQHKNTPSVQTLDVLGRAFREAQLLVAGGEAFPTHTELDSQGNALSQTDPRLLAAGAGPNFRTDFGMNGMALRSISADSGTYWTLYDATDSIFQAWDSRGYHQVWLYDSLGRTVQALVQGNGLDQVVEEIHYGESVSDSMDRNLRGQIAYAFDQAGSIRNDRFSFRGKLLQTTRTLRAAYKAEANWNEQQNSALAADHPWRHKGFELPDPHTEPLVRHWAYDALGRVVREEKPLAAGQITYGYHLSGRLNAVAFSRATEQLAGVIGISYNARNQRETIQYDNGVSTRYAYDPDTWSLTSLVSHKNGTRFQDVRYTYDPVGNITRLRDNSHRAIFTNNSRIEPLNDYTYDARYRLTRATGRHRPGTTQTGSGQPDYAQFFQSPAGPNDDLMIRNYTRQYAYDQGDNLLQIRELGGFTRDISCDAGSNRALVAHSGSSPNFASAFDANGNLLALDHLQGLTWNYRNALSSATIIRRDANQLADAEYYVYDGDGKRVRKVGEFLEHGGANIRIEEKIYLEGFELSRTRYEDRVSRETQEVHLLDDQRRIAIHRWVLVGKKTQEAAASTRYQLGNHLDSAAVEVNAQGELITYEEYYPYGGTALVAGRSEREVKEKEYRYSGKERDSATGLYYYGSRYYAPWLGRWLNPDPLGPVDGLNGYFFVGNNPIRHIDPAGNKYKQAIFKGPLGNKKNESPLDKLLDSMDTPKVKAMMDKGIKEASDAFNAKTKADQFDVPSPADYVKKAGLEGKLKPAKGKVDKLVFDFDVRVFGGNTNQVKFGKSSPGVEKFKELAPQANPDHPGGANAPKNDAMVIHGSFDLAGLGHVITERTAMKMGDETVYFDLPVTNYQGTGKLGMKQNAAEKKAADQFYANFEGILMEVDLSKAPDALKAQYADRMEDGKVGLDVHELANMSVVLGMARLGIVPVGADPPQEEAQVKTDPPPLQRRHTI